MPWKECSLMSQREELVALACVEGANLSALCQRLGVSRKTAYKWVARARAGDAEALKDRSRRPRRSPSRTGHILEQTVVRTRDAHPAWGGRKIRRVMQNAGLAGVPAASTVTAILHRHGMIDPEESRKREAFVRFEHEQPNDLWQMDFKGHVALASGGRCHPLTVLDDHSRYCVGLRACLDEQGRTVEQELVELFRIYGCPQRMLMDNGSPWGSSDPESRFTPLTVRLLRLGIGVTHGRPYHPQTQGKDERFHRTLKAEVLRGNELLDQASSQRLFDSWRDEYNQLRPHDALALEVPASRYHPSRRPYPERLEPIEYLPGDEVRKVGMYGRVSFRNRVWRAPRAFCGEPVAIRATETDGLLGMYYCRELIATLDLRTEKSARTGRPLPASARCARSVGQREDPELQ